MLSGQGKAGFKRFQESTCGCGYQSCLAEQNWRESLEVLQIFSYSSGDFIVLPLKKDTSCP